MGFHQTPPGSILERCDTTPSPILERSEAESKGRHEESGETLVETLITVVLMGLVVVGLLMGLLSVARMADHNNRVTHVGNTAQSYAEQLKQPVEAMEYRPCASPSYPDVSGNLVPGTAYEVDVSDVRFATAIPDDGATGVVWSDTCPTDPEGDRGLQMLTVRVRVTRGGQTTTEFVPLVKRDARCEYSPQYDNADLGPC